MQGDCEVAEIRHLTRNLSLPDGACAPGPRFTGVWQSSPPTLTEHMRLENDVLFPIGLNPLGGPMPEGRRLASSPCLAGKIAPMGSTRWPWTQNRHGTLRAGAAWNASACVRHGTR